MPSHIKTVAGVGVAGWKPAYQERESRSSRVRVSRVMRIVFLQLPLKGSV